MQEKAKNLWVRIGSGAAVFVVVTVAAFVSEYSFALLVLAVCIGTMWEFFRIAELAGAQPLKWYSMAAAAMSVVLCYLVAAQLLEVRYLLSLAPIVSVIFIAELYRKKDNPIYNVSVSIGALAYVALPMSLLFFITFREGVYSPYIFLTYMITVWLNDVFAYIVGVTLGRHGKHKLFERLSPKKSWEGFIGGLVFAVGFAVLAGWWMGGNLWVWAGFGVVVVISGVFGDLVESMFKRSVHLKDSGHSIPGHGGFLDRFDAVLLSVPFVTAYFLIFAHML